MTYSYPCSSVFIRGQSLILLLAVPLLVYQAWHLGLTTDEPSHLAAAYAWWQGADILTPSDTPPLTRIISGWVPRVMHIPMPHDSEEWRSGNAYRAGAVMIWNLPPARARRLIFFSRLPFIIFPLLIAFLLGQWGRELFTPSIGLLLAACALLEPTILGHGALIKSDVPAAFGGLWFAYAAWRYWLRPDLRRLLHLTLALVIATLIKFTLLPLLAFALILALWRGPRLTAALLIPLAFYLATLAAYQFQAAPVSRDVAGSFAPAGVPRLLMPIATTLAKLPWPDQYIRGLAFILGSLHGPGFTGYLLGHKISGVVPAYYPLAWAVKFPIPLQLLTLAGLAALLVRIRNRQACAADAFIFGSAVFYFGTAVASSYHIGFRHVLPALPFFILGGGFALSLWTARAFITAGLAWLAISSLAVYPQGISYFNEWIGGPNNGWKYLVDSNLDWGQNMPELAAFGERHHIPVIKTFLFGPDNPYRYLTFGTWESQPWPNAPGVIPVQHLRPTPGIYAISVNALAGLTAPAGCEDYLLYFRNQSPIGRAGYGVLIFSVN